MKKTVVLILLISLLLCGCGAAPEEETTVRVGALTGPTAMGMVKLMDDSDRGLAENSYSFTLQSDASAFAVALAKGEVDIAAVPANLASVIYNNTDGGVKVLAVNALGVLSIAERGDSIQNIADLRGKTLYATGAGAAPEYALRYLLSQSGMDADKDVSVQWCADTTEALSYLTNDGNAIAMLPQPFVTAAQQKLDDLRVTIDLNELWQSLDNGSEMVTGVLCVRTEFAEKCPQQLEKFMNEYESSVNYVLNNSEEAAALIGQYGIAAEAIALQALPHCNICFLSGEEMKTALSAYLNILYNFNPKAVGGSLPGEDFYYGA